MPVLTYQGIKSTKEQFGGVEDALAVEEALHISINGVPFTVTMRCPGNEEELVRGLLYTEDVYRDTSQHPLILIKEKNKLGFITHVDVLIAEEKILKPYRNSRSLLSVSSCGICGKTELENLSVCGEKLDAKEKISADAVGKMFSRMDAQQETFQKSGGSHAAAAFSLNGELLSIQEDIGRHNAVDKVIGRLLMDGKLKEARCLTVSGRISYEIVSKSFIAGIPFLAAVSAPSSMAVDFAKELGITLMAFCRNGNFTVYSNAHKVNFNQQKN